MSNEPDWLEDLYAEGGDEQPPEELDDRIRAAARQPARPHWYASPGRLATLATAASLVIAASIIYFEPKQETLLEAPAQSVADEAIADQEPGRTPVRKNSARELAEPERQDAERMENADRMGAMEEIAITAAPPAAPAEPAAADAPLPSVAAEAKAEVSDMESDAFRSPSTVGSSAGLRSLQTTPLLEQEVVSRDLERECGPLPGTEEDRALHYDGSEWLVVVRIGEDVRTWRCRDGAWIETASEQQ